ncbi:MAG: CoA-transferase [Acidimicrobiia bacterium]
MVEHLSLSDAVERHVRPGDAISIYYGHTRWTAAGREVVRQFWGRDPGFELQWFSMGTLGAMFFSGGLVRKVVTAYSGDGFPTAGPSPIYTKAYRSGQVEVEHWSGLAMVQRYEAAARGLPAIVTGSIAGSTMENNPAFHRVETEFGAVGLLQPLVPDVVLMHAPVADRAGNIALAGPHLESMWAAWAARRGAIVTVDKIVDDLSPYGSMVHLPGYRVLSVSEVPFGAHPGGSFARGLPAPSYGEDIPFWIEARNAVRGDWDGWVREWCLDVPDQDAYLAKIGQQKLDWLSARSNPESWRDDEAAHPVDEVSPVSSAEAAATIAGHELERRIHAIDCDAVLAGAGLSNLSAWIGAGAARDKGHHVRLAAEVGMYGYIPTPADPYVFNHRVFPKAEMLADMSTVLGLIVSGPGTRSIGMLAGAQVDRFGHVNSTDIPGTSFIVGAGGGTDVACGADECIVVMPARPERTPRDVSYITSPGHTVQSVCTDLGILRKRDGEMHISAVPEGPGTIDERVRTFRSKLGWEAQIDRQVTEISAPSIADAVALRRFDPQRLYLAE